MNPVRHIDPAAVELDARTQAPKPRTGTRRTIAAPSRIDGLVGPEDVDDFIAWADASAERALERMRAVPSEEVEP